MLVVNDALFVAGGQNVMVFNVSSRDAILQQKDDAVVATCTGACTKVMLSAGQNAHSLAYERRAGRHGPPHNTESTGGGCLSDRHILYLTAQIDNRVGAVELVAPAAVQLVCAGMELAMARS